jgi:hypothetical protein
MWDVRARAQTVTWTNSSLAVTRVTRHPHVGREAGKQVHSVTWLFGMWGQAVVNKLTDFSKENTASIFRFKVKEVAIMK